VTHAGAAFFDGWLRERRAGVYQIDEAQDHLDLEIELLGIDAYRTTRNQPLQRAGQLHRGEDGGPVPADTGAPRPVSCEIQAHLGEIYATTVQTCTGRPFYPAMIASST
jgi:hypothetical protein